MKKILFVLVIGLLVCSAVFSDHEGLGIGVVGGGGGGLGYGSEYGNVGLSLKIPVLPIFWGVYGNFLRGHKGFGFTADYYFFDSYLIDRTLSGSDGSGYDLKLHWFLGGGLFFNLFTGGDKKYFDLGVRLPVGLSWHIINPLELFLAIAPGIGISNWKDNIFFLGVKGEIGLRLWL